MFNPIDIIAQHVAGPIAAAHIKSTGVIGVQEYADLVATEAYAVAEALAKRALERRMDKDD